MPPAITTATMMATPIRFRTMPEGRSFTDGHRLMNSPIAAAANQKGGMMM